jgi:NAD(P)-dependent dehydrogenase (short-subunit alcohol dehydrogenase family)
VGRLEGKVAFLTGAGAGIAKATALAYVREGAKVAIIELNKETGAAAEKDVRAAGGDAIFIETDVTNDASVKRAVDATVAKFGRLDVLFNCAGGSLQEDVPVHEMDLDVWNRTIALNLLHPFLTCRHAIPHMMKAAGGSIINVTSHLGTDGFDQARICGDQGRHHLIHQDARRAVRGPRHPRQRDRARLGAHRAPDQALRKQGMDAG